MRYWLVMPAAGTGQRFGGRQSADRIPKQYASLRGRTVIEWALAPFLMDSRCAGAVVALGAQDKWWPKVAERIPAVAVCQGGNERCESVRNALAALNRRAEKSDWVLVHDAARPCLTAGDLDRLLDRVASHAVGGILALPVADTLKRAHLAGDTGAAADHPAASSGAPAAARGAVGQVSVSASGGSAGSSPAGSAPAIGETVDRAGLWRAGTPQMFRYGRLVEALDQALAGKRYPTDEAQALEWLGEHPLLVESSAANIKVTTADDLAIVEAVLAGREGRK
jgi:2-C-methyl-D-erythritol 4-phosphate cytidylyltransferase